MSTEVVTTGRIEKGVLKLRNRDDFALDISRMRDGEVVASIRRVHATRSPAQNAYYHGVVIELLSKHIKGLNPDEIHDFLKAQFISKKGAAVDGNGHIVAEFVIGGSTTRLNKIEFTDYLERICQWAAGPPLNLYIPPPDPAWRENQAAAAQEPCVRCGELMAPTDLLDVEEEHGDGGQFWTQIVKVCRGCEHGDMRRTG